MLLVLDLVCEQIGLLCLLWYWHHVDSFGLIILENTLCWRIVVIIYRRLLEHHFVRVFVWSHILLMTSFDWIWYVSTESPIPVVVFSLLIVSNFFKSEIIDLVLSRLQHISWRLVLLRSRIGSFCGVLLIIWEILTLYHQITVALIWLWLRRLLKSLLIAIRLWQIVKYLWNLLGRLITLMHCWTCIDLLIRWLMLLIIIATLQLTALMACILSSIMSITVLIRRFSQYLPGIGTGILFKQFLTLLTLILSRLRWNFIIINLLTLSQTTALFATFAFGLDYKVLRWWHLVLAT